MTREIQARRHHVVDQLDAPLRAMKATSDGEPLAPAQRQQQRNAGCSRRGPTAVPAVCPRSDSLRIEILCAARTGELLRVIVRRTEPVRALIHGQFQASRMKAGVEH